MSKEKKIYVVGIGPGSYEGMTGAAATALEKSDVIVGYTVYIDLVKDHFPGKSFLTTPMRKEVDRCVMAFDEAMKDQTVSMICSGDAGVYGMAGLMYEIGANYPEVELEVVAGVTAANTVLPVIGVPIAGSNLDGMDALLSIVQMPSGIPVATVAINGSKNAAYLALQIMAIKHSEIKEGLLKERKQMEADAMKANDEVIEKYK